MLLGSKITRDLLSDNDGLYKDRLNRLNESLNLFNIVTRHNLAGFT